jgi:hypothetical protein
MDWKALGGAIGPLAQIGLPALGTLFGGPLGGAIGGIAGKAVAGALGVEPTPQAVRQAIADDPHGAAEKLKALEEETAQRKDVLDDVADARATTVRLVQAGSPIAYGPIAVSLIATLGFVIVSVIAMRAAPGDRDVTLFLLGAWNTAFASVMAYWVGSSSGSRAKDAVIGGALASAGGPAGQAVGTLIKSAPKR